MGVWTLLAALCSQRVAAVLLFARLRVRVDSLRTVGSECPKTLEGLGYASPRSDRASSGGPRRRDPIRCRSQARSSFLVGRAERPDAFEGAEVDISELGAIGEFVSSIAVLVTLVFLTLETRRNSRLLARTNSRSAIENRT